MTASFSAPPRSPESAVAHAFPRHCRLTRSDEYSAVFAFRRVLRGAYFSLHYGERRPPGASARLGLVMGKKFMRRAVGRNCLKRLAREAFRHAQPQLPACDLVLRLFVKMKKPDRQMRQTLALEVRQLLAKIGSRLDRQGGENPPDA
ncbi:MAG: ribonuclease P protein component [Zoogloeaceae bacterium]|jgi:ribonuclease P protein component|nr:ribonuclease P protein component [Zoogloeaceae bacterium]